MKRQIAQIGAKITKLQEGTSASDLPKQMMEHRSAIRNLSDNISSRVDGQKLALDNREGSIFSGINAVTKVMNRAAEALEKITEKVTFSQKVTEDAAAVKPLLDSIEKRFEAWINGVGRLRRLGYAALLVRSLLFVLAGVALQRETGLWPPNAETDAALRDDIWDRYGDDLVACIEEARRMNQAMLCRILDMKP